MSNNKHDNDSENKGKVKVGNLRLNKETVKDLTDSESKQIRGGRKFTEGGGCSNPCPATKVLCPHKTTVPGGCSPTVVNG